MKIIVQIFGFLALLIFSFVAPFESFVKYALIIIIIELSFISHD